MAATFDLVQTPSGLAISAADMYLRPIVESLSMQGYTITQAAIFAAPTNPHLLYGGEWMYLEDVHLMCGMHIYVRLEDTEEGGETE